jgi:predicted alpha/beta-fold hydrolase
MHAYTHTLACTGYRRLSPSVVPVHPALTPHTPQCRDTNYTAHKVLLNTRFHPCNHAYYLPTQHFCIPNVSLVMFPGGSHEGYVKWACVAAASRGWRAVVLNMRGCNGLPLTSARGYNAINTADLHVAVQSIHRCGLNKYMWCCSMWGMWLGIRCAWVMVACEHLFNCC